MDEDIYFMEHANLVSTRSKCMSRIVGAILVKEGRIITMGYNGTPSGIANCNDGGCIRCKSSKLTGTKLDKCRCVHAEINAIIFAARNGINISNSTMYTTSSPCLECAKAIINGGINRVVYMEAYNQDALDFLKECGIQLTCVQLM